MSLPFSDPSKAKRESGLETQLNKLHASLTGFPIDMAHQVPDYVLIQFAFDVFEQAGATLLVARGPSPPAAVVNAPRHQ